MAIPATPLSLVTAPSAPAFAELDERIIAAHSGLVLVRAPDDVHAPVVAHAARRLRRSGWFPIEASARSGAPLFREIATQLGIGALPCDPIACADLVAQAASSRRAAIVAVLPGEGTWDRAVAEELARSSRAILVVLVCAGVAPAWEGATFELAGDLAASDKLRWLSAIAEEAQSELPASDLRSLDAWWAKARRVSAEGALALDELTAGARAVLVRLALAGRSIPATLLGDRGDPALEELLAMGAAVKSGALVSLTPSCDVATLEASAGDEARLEAARMLGGGPGFDPDPWAYARAAELLVTAGAIDEADAAITKAARGVRDPQVAHDIDSRWFAAVMPITGAAGLALRLRSAERALERGEAIEAQRWCESARALGPEDPEISLLMGRALMQLGDIVAARVSLQSAEAAAKDDNELRARVAGELAELTYLAGDLAASTSHAEQAIELAESIHTRLASRNTIGKIHLAQGRWDAADEHFADDALTAGAAGAATAELRARLNRAIAGMSKGMLDEARITLERVLEDGARLGQDRARAHAYSNLGVIAYWQHDYGQALRHWEETTRFPQALRGRIASARTFANLAELRLRLGLVEHADHAIAFGRRLLGGRTAAAAASHFCAVAARIAIARGNTALARREADQAIVDAEAASDVGDRLPEAYVVAARVALDDGDVQRAEDAIARAERLVTNARGRVEVGILRALHLRALGQNALEAATHALSFVRAAERGSGEDDLLSELHSLLAVLHRDAGDLQAAQAHCWRAIAVRDQVAGALPHDIRAAFLAKPEVVALSRLQASLASQHAETEEEAPRTPRLRVESSPDREIVGDDHQIRSLLLAIRKVARANSTILIRGESGTGKELVAEALHRASDRANGPLVSVNCAALVETLLLSELFGHEKGAFTGASSRRRGRFELAEGGTLFLDEIGDISPRTQVALLRVLQEKTFERVGSTTPIRANVQVICATHRDLKAMVERGDFREDLYYRLRGITLEVPPLSARLGDLPKIADHLLARIAVERGEGAKKLGRDALDLLQRHRWPGNVRELENVLRAVSLFAEGDVVTTCDLIDNVEDLRMLAQAGPSSAPPGSLRGVSLLQAAPAPLAIGTSDGGWDEESGALPDDESGATAVAYAHVRHGAVSLADMKRQIERDCIARALLETKGNITRAAALLGMKRPRLSQLVKQYGLSASSEGCQ